MIVEGYLSNTIKWAKNMICAEVLADQLRFMNPDPSHEYVPSLVALGRNPWFLALSHFGQRFWDEPFYKQVIGL